MSSILGGMEWTSKKRNERKETELYQCIVEADVSLQASTNMVELNDGDFSCSDGEDVLQAWWHTMFSIWAQIT